MNALKVQIDETTMLVEAYREFVFLVDGEDDERKTLFLLCGDGQ